jgi:aromatic-L-amino-acid decarboxylase
MTLDISPDEFRQYGHQLIEWMADYLENGGQYPVLSRSEPGQIASQISNAPPEQGETMVSIFSDFEKIIMPGITHWNQPGFLAYFNTSGSAPGILGEMLTSALNVNAMLWRTSPAATELEEVTLGWLLEMIGLPDLFQGVITDGASVSSLLAVAAAREALNLDIRQKGMAGRTDLPRLRLYISEETHSSVEKGAITIGIGQEGVRKIPVDSEFRMNPKALRQAIEEDIAAGWRPFCVAATIGTTATTSIDPIPQIAAICQEHHLWLHVDGAYGGTAAIVPEMQHILAGVELADSFVFNPHKWMFVPLDCSAFYVKDARLLRQTFSLIPDYLKTDESEVTNYMDWGVQLGRRFRALKLWMVIRTFGRQGLIERIREHLRLGQELAAWVDAHPDFERLAPTPFSTVCLRYCPHDLVEQNDEEQTNAYLNKLNMAVIETINANGRYYLSGTHLNGRYVIRVAISGIRNDQATINGVWDTLRETAVTLDRQMRVVD